jgi:putative transposase
MNADQRIFFRRHARMRAFDYRENRAYFVTICAAGRACVFGDVVDAQVKLSRRGLVLTKCWNEIPAHHPHVELDAFVVMPNHVHGLLLFVGDPPEATQASQLHGGAALSATTVTTARGPAPGSLSAVIGSFKSAVSREINRIRPGAARGLWQLNFYEHVVRHDRAHHRIRDYIASNPERWADDEENPTGTGRDDVRAFVASLEIAGGSQGGDAGVAATGASDA